MNKPLLALSILCLAAIAGCSDHTTHPSSASTPAAGPSVATAQASGTSGTSAEMTAALAGALAAHPICAPLEPGHANDFPVTVDSSTAQETRTRLAALAHSGFLEASPQGAGATAYALTQKGKSAYRKNASVGVFCYAVPRLVTIQSAQPIDPSMPNDMQATFQYSVSAMNDLATNPEFLAAFGLSPLKDATGSVEMVQANGQWSANGIKLTGQSK